MIGSEIAHFKVLAKLGKGGMGEVYKAQDTKLGRIVALKFLSDELNENPGFGERFLREAQAVAALNHPHICTIYETGEYEGRPFFAMEYLEGKTLKEVVEEGPLENSKLMSVAMQLADALHAAHTKGILHRDLKPGNIIWDVQGKVKLFDFGLAKAMNSITEGMAKTIAQGKAGTEGAELSPLASTNDGSLTQAGSTLGTLAYMSPEQLRCEELGPRSDLFAFGLILQELAKGKMAFDQKPFSLQADELLGRVQESSVSPHQEIPLPLDAVIQRLIQHNPEDRFASAAEAREALMSLSLVPAGAEGGNASAPFLSTLGRKRSPFWIYLSLAGVMFLGIWSVDAKNAFAGDTGWHLVGLVGVALLGWSWLAWWKSGRALRGQKDVGLVKISRLEEEPEGNSWNWIYLLFWGGGILFTFLIARDLWSDWKAGTTVIIDKNFIFYIIAALFYYALGIASILVRGKALTRKSREIEVHGSYAQILASISQIIMDLEARVTGLNLEKGLIRASTSATLKDFGERISFSVRETSPGIFNVSLESQSNSPFTVFDLGKNKDNLRRAVIRFAR
jgi:predicted Ser/Thr protein kinase